MKILKDKVTKRIRKSEFAADDEQDGRKCENCGTKVMYGNSMANVSARVHTHLTVTCHFCLECRENNDAVQLVETAVEARIKHMKSLGEVR